MQIDLEISRKSNTRRETGEEIHSCFERPKKETRIVLDIGEDKNLNPSNDNYK